MLTIAYITSRKEPRFDWFLESLASQLLPTDKIQVVIVDFLAQCCDLWANPDVYNRYLQVKAKNPEVLWVPPMPSVWQGPHRLTKDNWWAMAAARNTALCYAKGDWFLHLDDRCVLQPGFMAAVREHMKEKKFVFGTYQKRTGITVENGVIKHAGIVIGEDNRADHVKKVHNNQAPFICGGEWYYGCCGLGPLEWYLNVNGWDSTCDGLSFEDVILGLQIQNNGYPMVFDHRLAIVEDRTPGCCDPQFKREDKGVSPHDKSHALLDMLKPLKRAKHNLDLRAIRKDVLEGKPFPEPWGPMADWYDGQLIKDF